MKKSSVESSRGCATCQNEYCRPFSWNKLNVYDYLKDVPKGINGTDLVEVRFKNTRKEYYQNVNNLQIKPGDMVAVEASPGHDLGIVSLTGELVKEQLKKNKLKPDYNFKKIYRLAKPADVEKWENAIGREVDVMLRSRKIANDLGLNMKIGDVEFQGDGTKAIFYYIADGRVDFRKLIRVLADTFKIRVEMKQIGARQEAGRIGGVGSCGRELCCSSWMTDFVSVTTDAVRDQEIGLNPQKLAGQCGKLKCCLNYEVDSYIDAKKDFPRRVNLKTKEGPAYYMKTDVYKETMWYSCPDKKGGNIVGISVERVREVLEMNKKGEQPDRLEEEKEIDISDISSDDILDSNSITRFDKKKKKPAGNNYKKKKKRKPANKKRKNNRTNEKPSEKSGGNKKNDNKK
jgi:cell fate regulator YaaT (PSP1 superfamily)